MLENSLTRKYSDTNVVYGFFSDEATNLNNDVAKANNFKCFM